MPTIRVYPSGTTSGSPATTRHVPETKRGEVAGWSKESARRHAAFLRSVDYEALAGHLYSFTLTVRDTPATAREWAALRAAWLERLRKRSPDDRAAFPDVDAEPSSLTVTAGKGPVLLAYHWVTEWQKRGTPHTHGALVWSEPLTPAQRAWVRRSWQEVAKAYRATWAAQDVSETLSAGSWARYVAKHSARSAGHYQRSQMPAGWKASGRLWGASPAGWPRRSERYAIDAAGGYQMRRLVRSWRIADARKERDPETRRRRISSARQMLKAPAGWAGRVRGVSEWPPEAASIEMLRWLSEAGYDVQYCDDDTPAGGDDDDEETTQLVRGSDGGAGSESDDEQGTEQVAEARTRPWLLDGVQRPAMQR